MLNTAKMKVSLPVKIVGVSPLRNPTGKITIRWAGSPRYRIVSYAGYDSQPALSIREFITLERRTDIQKPFEVDAQHKALAEGVKQVPPSLARETRVEILPSLMWMCVLIATAVGGLKALELLSVALIRIQKVNIIPIN